MGEPPFKCGIQRIGLCHPGGRHHCRQPKPGDRGVVHCLPAIIAMDRNPLPCQRNRQSLDCRPAGKARIPPLRIARDKPAGRV
jgi:hypothetical protein